MSKYFRFIGTVGIILCIALTITEIVDIATLAAAAAKAREPLGFFDVFSNIVYLILFVVFGPALSLLFISHADSIEMEMNSRKNGQSKEYQYFGDVIIKGNKIIINDKKYDMIEINGVSAVLNEVSFVVKGNEVTVKCDNIDEATKLYNILRSNSLN